MNHPVQNRRSHHCDREPIHILGAIQPIGFLLALTADWLIARASADIERHLGIGRRSCRQAVGGGFLGTMRARSAQPHHVARSRSWNGCSTWSLRACPASTSPSLSEGSVVMGEPSRGASRLDRPRTLMIGRLDQCADTPSSGKARARARPHLRQGDGVSVRARRFRRGRWRGGKPGIGTFFGLRYPASDIPQQARELYKRNLLRIIADVRRHPSPSYRSSTAAGPRLVPHAARRVAHPHRVPRWRGASPSISSCGGRPGACSPATTIRRAPDPRAPRRRRAVLADVRDEARGPRAAGSTAAHERRARDVSDQLLGRSPRRDPAEDPDWLADILTPPYRPTAWHLDRRLLFLRRRHRGVPPHHPRANGTMAGRSSPPTISLDPRRAPAPLPRRRPACSPSRFRGRRATMSYLFRSELVRSVRWGGRPAQAGRVRAQRSPPDAAPELRGVEGAGAGQVTALHDGRAAGSRNAARDLIEVVLRLADEATAERQQASARQEMLIAELNHRVRNILGVIRGLISTVAAGGAVGEGLRAPWSTAVSTRWPAPTTRSPTTIGAPLRCRR